MPRLPSTLLAHQAEGVIWDALRGALVTRALGLAADLRPAQALSSHAASRISRWRNRYASSSRIAGAEWGTA